MDLPSTATRTSSISLVAFRGGRKIGCPLTIEIFPSRSGPAEASARAEDGSSAEKMLARAMQRRTFMLLFALSHGDFGARIRFRGGRGVGLAFRRGHIFRFRFVRRFGFAGVAAFGFGDFDFLWCRLQRWDPRPVR